LWAYSGFAVETHDSGEYRYVRGKLQRNRERITVRGLSDNHNPDLKNLFKGAAISSKSRGTLTDSGLDLETQTFSASGRGRGFFLTSLFIELIDPG
jgi:hypothetical protein